MESIHVIKKPLLSEKGTYASSEQNRYTFLVDRRADKTQIKRAIEDLYNVRVIRVNTQIRQAANRRLKYGMVVGKETKRAIIKVHPKDTIELF